MFSKNRFGVLFFLFAVFIILSTAIRTLLLIKSLPNIDVNTLLFMKVYGMGFFYDCVTFSYFAFPFALYLTFVPDRIWKDRYHRILSLAVFFVVIYVLVFDAVAEFLFFDEFGTRFNFIAIDYLIYTREVVGNIRESYHLNLLLAGILLATGVLFLTVRKHIGRPLLAPDSAVRRYAYGAVLLFLPVVSFAFVDQSFTMISGNSYANELAGNGIYDLFAAFRNNELDFNKFYLTRDENAVLARLRGLVRERNNHLVSSDLHDITREIKNPGLERKLNVIVIVEESLSAEYLGAFGSRKSVTPSLDRLAKESLLFTHLYATGTRTVRGLEAITLSMPPLPGISMVKRPKNENLFSWGSLMRAKGYDTKFIYAGYGYFDDMNYFFSHNGFDIVDRSDFEKNEITFSNAWGVCDEDLFRKVIGEAGKSYRAGKPFFGMVMTTSNHRPYTYPDGKIDIPSGAGREGGVKYADYAVGRFIEEAKRKPWFADTVFVVVADHCASSAGKTEIPVKRYEIPLLVYSPAHIRPARVDTLASQIDVAPTVLGLLNFSYRTKFLGKDILKTPRGGGRAFLSTYQKLGYLDHSTLVVLSPQKRVKTYSLARTDGSVKEIPPPEDAVRDALAYYQGIDYLSAHKLNRIP